MIQKINALLSIRQNESQKTWLSYFILLTQQFFATVFYISITTLYLEKFDATNVPIIYIVANFFSIFLSKYYLIAEKKIGRRLSIFSILALMAFLLTASGILFVITTEIHEGFYLAVLVLASITQLTVHYTILWPLLSDIFDIRQTKRVYGFISSGYFVGRIIAGILMPVMLWVLNFQLILLISGLLFATQIFLYSRLLNTTSIVSKASPKQAEKSKSTSDQPVNLKTILSNKYIQFLNLSVCCHFASYYMIDFLYLSSVEQLSSSEAIAQTLSMIFTLVSVMNIAGHMVLNKYMMRWFGVGGGLYIGPILILVMMIGTTFLSADNMVWILIAIYATNVGTICYYTNSMQTTFQPIPSDKRSGAKAYIYGVIASSVTVSVSLLLFVMTSFTVVSYVLIGILALWVFSHYVIVKLYPRQLALLFQKNLIKTDFEELFIHESHALKAIFKALDSSDEKHVIYAISMLSHQKLASSFKKKFQDKLIFLLENSSERVCLHVLEALSQHGNSRLADRLWEVAQQEPSLPIRGASIEAYCAIKEEEALPEIRPYLDHPQPAIRAVAITSIYRYGGIQGIFDYPAALKRFLDSEAEADRIFAAEILYELAIPNLYQPISDLLNDPHLSVKRLALKTGGKIRHPKLIDPIISHLKSLKTQPWSIEALIAIGEDVIPPLEETLRQQATHHVKWKKGIFKTLGGIGSVRAQSILMDQLSQEHNIGILHCICQELVKNNSPGTKRLSVSQLDTLIGIVCRYYYETIYRANRLEKTFYIGRLKHALHKDTQQCLQLLFYLLYLQKPNEVILNLYPIFEKRLTNEMAEGLELLDNWLPKKLKRKVIPLLDNVPDDEKLTQVASQYTWSELTFTQHLEELLHPQNQSSHWVKVVAIHTIITFVISLKDTQIGIRFLESEGVKIDQLVDLIESVMKQSEEYLVREMALEGLRYLLPNRFQTIALHVAENDPDYHVRRFAQSLLEGKIRTYTLEKVLLLKNIELFQEVDDEALAHIVLTSEEVDYAPKEVIFEANAYCDACYIILSGTVQASNQENSYVHFSRGDLLGGYSILAFKPYETTAITKTSSLLLQIRQEDLFRVLGEHPHVVQEMFKTLVTKIRATLNPKNWQRKEEERSVFRELSW